MDVEWIIGLGVGSTLGARFINHQPWPRATITGLITMVVVLVFKAL